MDKDFETVNTTTRFGHGPDEEDITIDYFDEKRFEVRGKNIAGPLIVALDSSLDPDVPKGARLLVNERQTEVNKRGIYVFRRANRSKGFDIAIVEPLGDGSFRYEYDKANPQILSDLSGMELVGSLVPLQTSKRTSPKTTVSVQDRYFNAHTALKKAGLSSVK